MRRKTPHAWSSANRVCNLGIVKSSFQYKLILKDSPRDEVSGFFYFLPQRFQNMQYLCFDFNRERGHPGEIITENPLFPRSKTCILRRHIQLLTGLKASNLDVSPKEFLGPARAAHIPLLHKFGPHVSILCIFSYWVKEGEQRYLYMNLTEKRFQKDAVFWCLELGPNISESIRIS